MADEQVSEAGNPSGYVQQASNPSGYVGFLRKFVKRVCINIKKHELAESARAELSNQLKKVKHASLNGKKKWLVEQELKILEKKIEEVLKYERALLSMGKSGSIEIRDLRRNIESLQTRCYKGIFDKPLSTDSEKIDSIKSMLIDVKDKMGRLLSDKNAREKRISEIEQKLRRKSLLKSNLGEIEKRLRELNQSYDRIKYKTDDYRADEIQNRINFMRAKIQELG